MVPKQRIISIVEVCCRRSLVSNIFYTLIGELRRISKLNAWGLKNVLIEKYLYDQADAEMITSFLLPMLNMVPEKRATAAQMLNHPWMKGDGYSRLPPLSWDDL